MKQIEFKIEGAYHKQNCFPGMNDYTRYDRANRYAGNGMKQKFSKIAQTYIHNAKVQNRLDIITGPVAVKLEMGEIANRRDLDNITIFATKIIFDAMQKEGVINNDKQIMKIESVKQLDKKPYIRVEVEEYDKSSKEKE